MKLTDASGHSYNVSKGKVVLFCYPKDSTPGCTIEAKQFSDLLPEFKKKGISVYGVGKGDGKSHAKFTESCNLSVPLLVDEDLSYVDSLGILKDKSMFGKAYKGIERTTLYFEDGKEIKRWEKVNPLGHAKKVLEELAL